MNAVNVIFIVILLSVILFQHCRAQVKHPQEIDLSDLEDDIELLNYRERKNNRLDCVTFYRRLVKHLFKKERFQPDPASNNYIASVPLRLKPEQWELLTELDGLNLDEIDDLIAEVLKRSNDADWDYPVSQILFDHYRHQLVESLPSINSPIVLIGIAIIVIIFMNRFFHFSKLTFSAVILLVIISICVISYAMMYWECLSELEVEEMIRLSKKESVNNPCKDYDGEHRSIWSSLRATMFGSSESECIEHMRKTFKTSKKYCDPLDVFAKWCGKIQMSYFTSILGGFFELISHATSSSNLFSKIIIYAVGTAIFVFLVYGFGKMVIVHLLKGTFGLLANTRLTPETNENSNQNSSLHYHRINSKLDEVLLENQMMRKELLIIRECSVERSTRSSPPRIEDSKRLKEISEEPPENNTS